VLSKKRLNLIFLSFGVFFSFYILFIKSNLYVSETSIMVNKLDSSPNISVMSGLLGGNSSKIEDIKIIENYIYSKELFEKLNKEINLVLHYKSNNLDFIQRIMDFNSFEDILELFYSRISFSFEEVSGIINISFYHLDKAKSQKILTSILSLVESKLNELNSELNKKQLKFVELESKKIKNKLDNSIQKLKDYQDKNKILDPSNNSINIVQNINTLESSIIKKELTLKKLLIFHNTNSIEIKNLISELKSLNSSLVKLNSKLTGSNTSSLNQKLIEYNNLKNIININQELYSKSLLILQTTKTEVNKINKVIQKISLPTIADSYSKPNKLYELISLWLILLIVYSIISMILGIIKDRKI